jgi:N-formylglutamate deformylase
LNPESTAVAELHLGSQPLIVSLPHVGTVLPREIAKQMTPLASRVPDTDWQVDRLYDFARTAGASWLQARISRYAIDVNRPPDDQSLYPGQTTSALCPTLSFSGEPLYERIGPSVAEITERRTRYWVPYHAMLRELIEATRARYGYAILLDAHSIRSELPRLFEGRLPDVNVGTNDGRSCAPQLSARLLAVLDEQSQFTHVLNGRFKGGYITRTYGNPETNVHAVQLELAQAAYMDESGIEFDPWRAQPLQSVLRLLITELLRFKIVTQPA